MDLHKIGVKFFTTEGDGIGLTEFIPVFHRWIQQHSLEDLLIDVADYSHVHAGPGTMLIAHEGNYGVDETGNRRGLLYYSKRNLDGDLAARLATVCRKTLTACKLLEQDDDLRGRIRFGGSEFQVIANDRLVAPNTDATYAAFRPALEALLARLYPAATPEIARESDPKERFSVTVRIAENIPVATLLERLEA
jgi:hypothetical protein